MNEPVSRKDQPFDIVQKPAHYNLHVSGVEAIELCEVLTFNIGNAFKYIFRRDDKEVALQDLKKARWYIDREYQRLKRYSWLPTVLSNMHIVNADFSTHHSDLAARVVASEKSESVVQIYIELLRAERASLYVERLPLVLSGLDHMIDLYASKESAVTQHPA